MLTFEKIDHETIKWKINPGDSLYQIHENFIVHNYRANKESEKVIDEFVCQYIDTLTREYSAMLITFYKESRITNMKNLKEWPDDIVRSMDRDYLWKYGFSSKNEFQYKELFERTKGRKLHFEEPECLIKNNKE